MDEKTDADILRESREYLAEHGWVRGTMMQDGTVCTLGAITWSQGWYDQDQSDCDTRFIGSLTRLARKLMAALGRPVDTTMHNQGTLTRVASWNDEEAEDVQQVLDLFAKAEKIEQTGFDPDEGVPL